MTWTFTRGADRVEQRVKIERGRAFANDWLVIRAAICAEPHIDPTTAMRFNARLALGALVMADGTCYMRATLPMDTLNLRDLDQTIECVARESARMRRPHIVTIAEPFIIFAD